MAGTNQSPANLNARRVVKTDRGEVIDFGVVPLDLQSGPSELLEPADAFEAESLLPAVDESVVEESVPHEDVFIDSDSDKASATAPDLSGKSGPQPVLPGQGIDADAVAVPATDSAAPAPRRSLFRRGVSFAGWCLQMLFGIVSLVVLLAVIAAIPIVNFLALGYLLEVEGRMARTGKLRDAFPLVSLAPRLGSIVVGVWLCVFPLRLLSNAAADARIIEFGSASDKTLHVLIAIMAVVVTMHVCLALARGGSLSCFFRPIKNARWLIESLRQGAYWGRAEGAVREFIGALRLKHHFWLGLRGYFGALAWLVIPTAFFAAATKTEGGPLILTLFGGVLLMLVLSWVPFLQAHFAAENRFGAMFELRKVRGLFRNAPFSWLLTMLVTLTFSLPLYLFTIALPPADAAWMVTIVFIVSIYPAKVITGWAYHRAVMRERRAHFTLRWLTRLVMVPLLAFFVFLLFFTQFIGAHGKAVLFEHHAFMLPAPF